MDLRKYNPFPLPVWVFLFLAFVSGYFTGAIVESKALENNQKNTCNFLERSR